MWSHRDFADEIKKKSSTNFGIRVSEEKNVNVSSWPPTHSVAQSKCQAKFEENEKKLSEILRECKLGDKLRREKIVQDKDFMLRTQINSHKAQSGVQRKSGKMPKKNCPSEEQSV